MGERLSKFMSFFVLATQFVEATSNHGSEIVSTADTLVNKVLSYSTGLIAVAVVICAVVVLIGCADIRGFCASFCPQQGTFRDFDEDGYFNDISIAAAPAVQFPMYPPVESTPDSRYSMSSVYFEPLPDIATRRRNQSTTATNAAQLRPKVAQIGISRMDSEEEAYGEGSRGVAQQYFDQSQELAKLEKLVTIIRRANSRNQFPRTQLQYIKEMGSGWFGKVLEGEGQGILPGHKKTKVVVQMLKEDADQHEKLTFLQEGLPYKEIQDPNVIKLLCHCVETSPFLMILEYCPIDLKSFMRNNRTAVESFDKERLILNFACDMARGLQAMHQHNYVHRDFAIRNCLVTADRNIKVGDFGLSEELFKEDYYYDNSGDGIPIRWLAPEVLSYSDNEILLKKITRDSNLWSYGVALWELVKFGTLPYTDLSNDNVLRLVVNERAVKLAKPDVPISNLDKLYQLMQRCWLEPVQRPSVRELLIMLLHLQTQTDQSDMSEFDQKWNQLMPRQNFDNLQTFASVGMTTTAAQNYAPSVMSNGTITTIAYSDGSDISGIPEVVIRPTSFGSEFSELNVSLLAEAGSLQTSLRSTSGTPDSPPVAMLDAKSPINEMSLAAELNFAGETINKDGDDADDEETVEVLAERSNNQFPPENVGSVNAGFLEERSSSIGGGSTIQLQAEVHKAGDGEQLMNVLGNVNQSFSLDFLSEEEDDSPKTKASGDKEKDVGKVLPGQEEFLLNLSETTLEFSDSHNQKLHRDSQKNPEELFNELVTSTPKVSDEKKASIDASSVSDAHYDLFSSYAGSVDQYPGSMDQSSIATFDDRSFMQPQKYTAYLQTVTTSVEGEDTEIGGDQEQLSTRAEEEPYYGLDAGFGDIFDKETLESVNQSKADVISSNAKPDDDLV